MCYNPAKLHEWHKFSRVQVGVSRDPALGYEHIEDGAPVVSFQPEVPCAIECRDVADLSYEEFLSFMAANKPLIIRGAIDDWKACREWVTPEGDINISFLEEIAGSDAVCITNCGPDIGSCDTVQDMTLRDYLKWWRKFDRGQKQQDVLYLKDWHFASAHKEYQGYTVPPFFQDDWLNEYYDSLIDDVHTAAESKFEVQTLVNTAHTNKSDGEGGRRGGHGQRREQQECTQDDDVWHNEHGQGREQGDFTRDDRVECGGREQRNERARSSQGSGGGHGGHGHVRDPRNCTRDDAQEFGGHGQRREQQECNQDAGEEHGGHGHGREKAASTQDDAGTHSGHEQRREQMASTQDDEGLHANVTTSDYRFVYLGPKGSHTPLHADVLRSYSWSANVCGRKLWTFLAPCYAWMVYDCWGRQPAPAFDVTGLEPGVDPSHYPFLHLARKHTVICVQEAGELVFVPSCWYHTVENLADTLSINHNWFNAFNARFVWAFLSHEYSQAAAAIEDCRSLCSPTEFEELVERNVAANAGMNLMEFEQLLERVKQRRQARGRQVGGCEQGSQVWGFEQRPQVGRGQQEVDGLGQLLEGIKQRQQGGGIEEQVQMAGGAREQHDEGVMGQQQHVDAGKQQQHVEAGSVHEALKMFEVQVCEDVLRELLYSQKATRYVNEIERGISGPVNESESKRH